MWPQIAMAAASMLMQMMNKKGGGAGGASSGPMPGYNSGKQQQLPISNLYGDSYTMPGQQQMVPPPQPVQPIGGGGGEWSTAGNGSQSNSGSGLSDIFSLFTKYGSSLFGGGSGGASA